MFLFDESFSDELFEDFQNLQGFSIKLIFTAMEFIHTGSKKYFLPEPEVLPSEDGAVELHWGDYVVRIEEPERATPAWITDTFSLKKDDWYVIFDEIII